MKSQSMVEYGAPLQELDADTPSLSGTEVLIKTTHCGVCHSDVHLHDGHFNMGGGNKLDVTRGRALPFTLGHEIEGTLESIGPEAPQDGLKKGSKYVVFPWIGCGTCGVCERGDEHLCNTPRSLGVNVNGGFASHVVVPHPRYLLSYDGIQDGLAATYMCSGLTAFSALKKLGDVPRGETICIVGLGGVGMMGLQFARALFPDNKIIGADIDANKLQAAKGAGADEVYNTSDEGVVKSVLGDTNGGVYGAIDFVGAEPSLNFATGIIRKGGYVVVVGLFGGGYATPIPMFPMRQMGILGSFVGSLEETKEMLELVKAGKIDPIPVETRSLAEATKTLNDLREGNVLGRVVLAP